MNKAQYRFSSEMKDFLSRLCMSRSAAPGSWSVVWDPAGAGDDVFSTWVYPVTRQAIIEKSKSLQFLNIGDLGVSAVCLRRGHGIVVEERPVDLKTHLRGEKKVFYGFKMGKNVLYYCVTTWPREGLPGVLKARALLDQLAKGDLKSDYRPYLPESRVVELIASGFGLRWVHCRHKEYYYRDRRFRYISVEGHLLEPSLNVQIFIFDKEDSLQWLMAKAKPVPEYERMPSRHIAHRVHGQSVLVLTEDLCDTGKTGLETDLHLTLQRLAAGLEGGVFNLSAVDISTIHTVDPEFQWKNMLGRYG
ncbi:MAG: hypothetical protein AB1500_04025 [Bacillota bacterium]